MRSIYMNETGRRYYFIVNPYSSKGGKATIKLNKLIHRHSINYKILKSSDLHYIKDIIRKIQGDLQKKDIIVAVGGDGTLSEVIQACQELNIPNPVGLLPAGSGNDFARFHQIPRNFNKAFKYLLSIKETTKLDVIVSRSNQTRYNVNSIGCGIDGRVIHNLHQKRGDNHLSTMAYLRSALTSLFRQKPFNAQLKIEGQLLNVYQTIILVFMTQGTFGGGINLHPNSVADDGCFEIIFSHRLNAIDLVSIIYTLLNNGKHLNHPKIYTIKAKTISVHLESAEYWQADGEDLGQDNLEMMLEMVKQNYWI